MKTDNKKTDEDEDYEREEDFNREPDYWGCYSCGETAYPKPMGCRCPVCDAIMEEEYF